MKKEKLCKTVPIRKRKFKNQFKDDGTLFKEDALIDKKIKRTVSPRRPKVKFVKLSCRRCNKIDKVANPPKELTEYYICNDCIVGS